MGKGIIDRFENGYAVIEINGKTEDFPLHLLPKEAKIGDVVTISVSDIVISKEETKKRAQEISDLMDEIWEKE